MIDQMTLLHETAFQFWFRFIILHYAFRFHFDYIFSYFGGHMPTFFSGAPSITYCCYIDCAFISLLMQRWDYISSLMFLHYFAFGMIYDMRLIFSKAVSSQFTAGQFYKWSPCLILYAPCCTKMLAKLLGSFKISPRILAYFHIHQFTMLYGLLQFPLLLPHADLWHCLLAWFRWTKKPIASCLSISFIYFWDYRLLIDAYISLFKRTSLPATYFCIIFFFVTPTKYVIMVLPIMPSHFAKHFSNAWSKAKPRQHSDYSFLGMIDEWALISFSFSILRTLLYMHYLYYI